MRLKFFVRCSIRANFLDYLREYWWIFIFYHITNVSILYNSKNMNFISVFFNFRRMKKYSLYLLFIALSCNKSEIPGELVLGDEVFDTGLVINDKNFKKTLLRWLCR